MRANVFASDNGLSFKQGLRNFWDRRLLAIFLLGFASGFPWVLIGSAMSAWLQEAGLTRTAIGFFGSIFTVYVFNFLWAPLLDRVNIPWLGRRLGQRRSWILAAQVLLLLLIVLIARTDPASTLLWTSLLALMIAIVSATQDVAIDAYRIEIINADEAEKIPAGSAMATSGWWTGFSLPGALVFLVVDLPQMNWSKAYLLLTLVVLATIAVVLIIREPVSDREAQQHRLQEQYQRWVGDSSRWSRLTAWLLVTVVEPIREFFRRNGWKLAASILLFIFLFKIGEAFLGRMAIVFYKEIGFTNADIGVYTKLIGWWVTIVFSVVGSLLSVRFGLIRGLLISGVAMASTNLMFAWLAVVGPDKHVLVAAIVLDNFTAAFATVTFVAFISYFTSRVYTATQYALMASLGNLGRTSLASFSGLMVDAMDGAWDLFFIVTAVMVIPSLILLLSIRKKLLSLD